MEPNQSIIPNAGNANSSAGPAPINTNQPTPQSPSSATPQPALSQTPETPSKPKQNKTLIICSCIFIVVALAVAAVFAIPHLTGQNSGSESQSTTGNNGEGENPERTDVETKITDRKIIEELDEKMAILLNTAELGSTISHEYNVVPKDVKIMQDGDLDQISRIENVINSLDPRKLNEVEIAAAIKNSNLNGENADEFRSNSEGYSGAEVREKYQQVFGDKLAVGAKADAMCEGYNYESQNDFYYDEGFGCGGATPVARFYYKYRYGSTSEKAYVYVATATFDTSIESDSIPVYCDVADIDLEKGWAMKDDAKTCATLTPEEADTFTLDKSNYTKFTREFEYRFVFDKADDGTLHFNKVEKVYQIS